MTILSEQFVIDALQSSDEFPIDFDDVWEISGYSRKDGALRFLRERTSLIEGLHFSTKRWKSPNGGRPSETVYMSVDAFKFFLTKSNTNEGDNALWYFIDVEKAYRQNLERQFNSENGLTTDKLIEDYEQQIETLQGAYKASQLEVRELSAAIVRLEAKLEPFQKQLILQYEFDLDMLWSMSGLTANRNYLIKALMDNFEYGYHYSTTPDKRPNKGGLPKTKFWLTQQCFNCLVIALRSIKGVPVDELPEQLVIDVKDFYKENTGKKNKLFPNRRK